jgi:phosphoribosylformylglycinamidine synthase
VTLWEVDIFPATGQPDLVADEIAASSADLALGDIRTSAAAHGYLIQGTLSRDQVEQLARELLADAIVERTVVAEVGEQQLNSPPGGNGSLVHVMLKPGVMDPVADSTLQAIQDFEFAADSVRTIRKYWIEGADEQELDNFCSRVLANDSIEQVVIGPLQLKQLDLGSEYNFELERVPLCELDDEQLELVSSQGQLYLTLVEMQTIQAHFQQRGREPTDAELETIAQTWSEHCSHKTLAGRIAYEDENGQRSFDNMLKETIFAATVEIRSQLGEQDWCVSVFEDNAGIIRFDDEYNVVFKVETHNHPSALEPYGGANTGIGGVIRDPMGTGMGAKPVCNTDVFCFAPPDTPADTLPAGVLHPRRVMNGVVSGVRDYGNRMGIPTVNGAIYFDPRYLGNPLVYCGNVGIIPREMSSKQVHAGDLVVALGGRTGRDGIHGATFSSAELTSDSETISGGAVQIGNAITEKMLLDVLLEARDRGLYNAVTDCGAGGFSSAVGEMGEKLGVEVDLEKVPLKYDGLSYTEIWISEAQERMVLAVPTDNWQEFEQLCSSEGVEATVIGTFVDTGRLLLRYDGQHVADLSMQFLHDGRPPVIREACYQPAASSPFDTSGLLAEADRWLLEILGSLNVASKEWVIRQYDHEVQGGSVLKPLVGVDNDGPGDAAVVRPRLSSSRGLVVSCGMNPYYGDLDTYHMAASAIDEALRNCVAVGADPAQIAILDNFCWGYTDRPETLGTLVRAALACYDVAVAMKTPFISGKDSLNNEFSYQDDGQKQTIAIPSTLLISALGQVADVASCVSMDLKAAGNPLYQLGETHLELGGSHLGLVSGRSGGQVPEVDTTRAAETFQALHQAIESGVVRACHDLSEGGLAVAAAEMAFAGGLGLQLNLENVPGSDDPLLALFSESNSRFLCEVDADRAAEFEQMMEGVPSAQLGQVTEQQSLVITSSGETCIEQDLADLKAAWQAPLDW